MANEPSLADRMLRGYERDLTVWFQGSEYPVWVLMEALLYVVDKDDENVRFLLNRQQVLLYKAVCDQKRRGEPMRQDVLKARQIGFSTFIAALFFTVGMFTPNMRIGIVADTLEHAQGIFDKYQHFYDCLDFNNPNRDLVERDPKAYGHLSYKPTLKYNKGQTMLQTLRGNSVIRVMAVSEKAGRSKTYSALHCSECAFWDKLEATLRSLLKTVSRKNPNSMVFLETTANGFNGYKRRWDRDYSRAEGSYNAHFVPWFDNPEYAEDVPQGYDLMAHLEPWESDRMAAHGLSERQMMWYHRTYLQESGGDRNDALQEYPFTPVDAFVSTGSSVFDRDLLAIRKEEVARRMSEDPPKTGRFRYERSVSSDGELITVSKVWFEETRGGPIAILSEPDPTHPYVVTCDPNMGGSDDVAMQVVDNYTGRQVARFKASKIPLEQCAYQLYCLGREYNWALASSEVNVGQIVMSLLMRMRYPRMHVSQAESYENYRRVARTYYGHKTTKSNRQFMIDSLNMAFSEDPSIVSDYDTLCEMESFQVVERFDSEGNVTSSKQEASGGAHDDLVMALAAFYLVRGQQSAVPTSAKPKGTPMTPEELESAVERNRARIKSGAERKGNLW